MGGSGSSGAVGSGAAAVESAAVSVIVPRAVVRVGALVGWDGCEVRLCVRLPEWSRLPPVSFYRYPVSFYRHFRHVTLVIENGA